jgi:hypothetical protein
MGKLDICSDDPKWLEVAQEILLTEIDNVFDELGDALTLATIRTYHGCRTADVGSYQELGILLNDPLKLAAQVRRIVKEEDELAYLRPTIEQSLKAFDSAGRAGQLYLAVDDRSLTNSCGHYLLYGSEWIQCVLGWGAHTQLRQRGVPTVISVDLPLNVTTSGERRELAEVLLQEWTRIKVNKPKWVPELDFAFCLNESIPGAMIVGHFHPETIYDTFYSIERRLGPQSCPACTHGDA